VVESGDVMLMGEYHHNIDEKGRIIIPSRLRDELGDNVIVTRGLDDCLFLYSMDEWSLLVSKLKSLPFTKRDARNFSRMFLSGATGCLFDKQGRVKISSPLIDYASLNHECVIIGVNDRIEIWAKEKWDKFICESTNEFSDLADHLFDIGG
jgi:MraZ protein